MKILLFTQQSCSYGIKAFKKLVDLGFEVTQVLSNKRGDQLPPSIIEWSGDLIIFYSGYFILPKVLLNNVTAAINFHPAPPEFPGSGCASWALYRNSNSYGVTLHFINEEIDNGEIIECRRFPIFPEDNLQSLINKTKEIQFDFFSDVVDKLSCEGLKFLEKAPVECLKWSGPAKKISEVDNLQTITPHCSQEELERIIRATHSEQFPLKLKMHGYTFTLNKK